MELFEATKPQKKLQVVFHKCDEFHKTFEDHKKNTPGVHEQFVKFLKHKAETPLEPFGSKDYHLGDKGNFGKAVPGLKHAGLTFDKSVFYTLSGSGDTRHVHLYGIYGHDEAGIGSPPNDKKQKAVSKRMSNQEFDE